MDHVDISTSEFSSVSRGIIVVFVKRQLLAMPTSDLNLNTADVLFHYTYYTLVLINLYTPCRICKMFK